MNGGGVTNATSVHPLIMNLEYTNVSNKILELKDGDCIKKINPKESFILNFKNEEHRIFYSENIKSITGKVIFIGARINQVSDKPISL